MNLVFRLLIVFSFLRPLHFAGFPPTLKYNVDYAEIKFLGDNDVEIIGVNEAFEVIYSSCLVFTDVYIF